MFEFHRTSKWLCWRKDRTISFKALQGTEILTKEFDTLRGAQVVEGRIMKNAKKYLPLMVRRFKVDALKKRPGSVWEGGTE
jgi:hypothetical protein